MPHNCQQMGMQALSSYSKTEQEIALRAHLQNRFKGSLFETAKYLCEYDAVTHYTHGGIIKALQAPTTRKLICVPRGTFKSSIGIVAYSIWLLLNNPNHRILIDSEKYENSKNFIREIKGKFESPLMRQLFGEFRSPDNWTEGSITIRQRTKVYPQSSITASGIGAGKVGQHYDVIIHDDLNSDKNSATPELRKKIIDHYKMNTSILEPGGIMVIIGTRYAQDDVIGWVLENEIGEKGLL